MGTRSAKPGTCAGIDVSAKELVVAIVRGRGERHHLTLPNTPEGHATLLRALKKRAGGCRVVLEATGNYHLDLALTLANAKGVELMVVNPMAARRFAQSQMRRAKTDKVDADSLLEFCLRMEFEPWVPPSAATLELRAVTRYLGSLIADQAAVKNRLDAANATCATPAYVLDDLRSQLEAARARIDACQAEAERVAATDPELASKVELLDSMPGIAARSAVLLLGELAVLDPEMGPDEIVAHAGLDPRPKQSGTRDAPRKISKIGNARLRAALYFPAVTAARCNPGVRAWYESLIARQKPAFVAHVAVMRRLLRVAWVILCTKKPWNDALFLPRAADGSQIPAVAS